VYGLKGSVDKLIPQVEALLAKMKSETTFVSEASQGSVVMTGETVIQTVGTVVETV
jgi:hypothetical protein